MKTTAISTICLITILGISVSHSRAEQELFDETGLKHSQVEVGDEILELYPQSIKRGIEDCLFTCAQSDNLLKMLSSRPLDEEVIAALERKARALSHASAMLAGKHKQRFNVVMLLAHSEIPKAKSSMWQQHYELEQQLKALRYVQHQLRVSGDMKQNISLDFPAELSGVAFKYLSELDEALRHADVLKERELLYDRLRIAVDALCDAVEVQLAERDLTDVRAMQCMEEQRQQALEEERVLMRTYQTASSLRVAAALVEAQASVLNARKEQDELFRATVLENEQLLAAAEERLCKARAEALGMVRSAAARVRTK